VVGVDVSSFPAPTYSTLLARSFPSACALHIEFILHTFILLVCIFASVDAALGRDVVLHGHLVHGC
jgi:hypothetical protein